MTPPHDHDGPTWFELLDEKIENLQGAVNKILDILHGKDGGNGLMSRVVRNSERIKTLYWIVGGVGTVLGLVVADLIVRFASR